jgi:hypothetical protein
MGVQVISRIEAGIARQERGGAYSGDPRRPLPVTGCQTAGDAARRSD